MVSIDRKKYDNHYKPGRTLYERVFAEILHKKLSDDVILVGARGNENNHALLIMWNVIPFYEYLYENYELRPPSNVRDRNSICT
ncbi:hypothetical protein T08_15185 [Trichinella sp. T8]|nr:hypothetical protein T08_15185 [Trichinella sp. T8]